MKSPHRAAALRGLLYCAAILIKKFLVDNAEIRSGAEKSMVLPDCRVEFFSSVRRRRALFQRRPLSPTRFAMRYPRRLSRRFRWSAPGQECFHTSFYESALKFQLVAVEIILTVEVQRCLLVKTENIVKICYSYSAVNYPVHLVCRDTAGCAAAYIVNVSPKNSLQAYRRGRKRRGSSSHAPNHGRSSIQARYRSNCGTLSRPQFLPLPCRLYPSAAGKPSISDRSR